ncbi:hepatic lectin-like [Asterias rubens]|uniref:hepatic lectin-like n=1 Tax=Asterias rubens TaxID=7604 RepID=UPI00145577D5|nr:hepatic lectin-like [Asterias rubens]
MERMTFDNAVVTCTDLSSRVVVPSSFTEHQFIWDMVSEVPEGTVHIGCTDREEEGKWVQPGDGGEECSFLHWSPGEPNTILPGEDCAFMDYRYGGQWTDAYCYKLGYVVCQRPAVTPTTTPQISYCLQADTNGRFVSIR